MTFRQVLCVTLLVVIGVGLVQPARAEAMEPTLLILAVGGAIVLVVLIAYLVVANVHEHQRERGVAAAPPPAPSTEAARLALQGA